MGKGGEQSNGTVQRGGKYRGTVSWDEVREHKERDDKWLVIDGEEAFLSFHNDRKAVSKFLKPIHVASLPKEQSKDSVVQQDFRELRETAVKMGLFKPSIFFYVTNLAHLLVLEFLSYFFLYYFGAGWLPWTLSLLCHVTMQAQAGWSQHDYGHLSVFPKSWMNHAAHQFVMCWLKGASCHWWNHMHYQHHAKPNVLHKDPDVRVDRVFVLGESMAKDVAKNPKRKMPYNYQHKYFFAIGPPLLFPIYFQFMIFRHTISRKRYMDLSLLLLYYLRVFLLLTPVLGLAGAVTWYILMRVLESHWFVWVAQSNHIPMAIGDDDEAPWLRKQETAGVCIYYLKFFLLMTRLLGGLGPALGYYAAFRILESHWFVWVTQSNHIPMDILEDSAGDWLPKQLSATCDIEKGVFNDWFTGHLNFQIEHHLFPTMPRHNLYKIAPLAKSLCEKHGVPYVTKPLGTAFWDIFRTLKNSGEMWAIYKHAYTSAG